MRTFALLLVFLAPACSSSVAEVADPGFWIEGTVSAPEALDYAPVLVQIFGGEARPYYAFMTSGRLSPGRGLALSSGALGCAPVGDLSVWVDVDGDTADWGRGGWEYDARPGPGDLVAAGVSFAVAPDSACALQQSALATVADQRVGGVAPVVTRVQVDVSAGAAPLSTRFSALAYRPEDIVKGRPRPGAAPLLVLGEGENLWSVDHATPHHFAIAAPAVPLRVWLDGDAMGVRYGALVGPTLFGGEDGTRGRAAVGLEAAFARLE